ncbi:MAG: hypothetical protein H0V01_13020 [Bacteroidetes bacterium]|nr:hypothetical protein [Bacteroidota bacterium]HET6244989.1 hypothetical protein [Bacteroidia bacterium]
MTNTENEIDLLKLFADSIYILKKKKKLLIAFFFIGVLLGTYDLIKNFKQPRYYYLKTYTVQSNQIPNDMMVEIINSVGLKLKHISSSLNSEILPNEPGLSQNILNDLRVIKAEIKPSNLIEIRIEANNKEAVDSIIKGVEHYVIINEYVKRREIFARSQKQKLLEVVDNLIEEAIDKKNLGKGYYESNASLIKLLTNGKFGNWSYIELFEQKQKIEKELAFSKELDFVITSNPYEVVDIYTGMFKKAIGFGFLGMFLGVLISLFLNLYQKAKKLIA